MQITAERAIELSSTELHAPALNSAFRDCADILQCPITGESLIAVEDGWSSAGGQRHYPIDQDIPLLFAPVDPAITNHDVTEMVKAFTRKRRSKIMMSEVAGPERDERP